MQLKKILYNFKNKKQMQKNTSIRFYHSKQYFGLSKNICMPKYATSPKVKNLMSENYKNKPWIFIENV